MKFKDEEKRCDKKPRGNKIKGRNGEESRGGRAAEQNMKTITH